MNSSADFRRRPLGSTLPLLTAVAFVCIVIFGATAPHDRLLAQQASIPPKVKAFLDHCDDARRAEIIDLEQTLRGLRSGQLKVKDSPARIKSVEADLERLHNYQTLVVPTFVFPPENGDIGRLPGIGGHVTRVLDDHSLLLTSYFNDPVVVVRNTRPVLQKVTRPLTFLVRGVPTAKLHAGMDLELSQVFEVTSIQHDNPAGKGLPVPVIEPFDLKQVEPYRQRR